MNDHADSSVSGLASGAGDADDTVLGARGFVDEAGEADEAVSAPARSVNEAEIAEAAAGPPDGTVDDAVNRLDNLESTDVSEHPAIYEDIHRSLASALDDTPTTQADQ